MIIFLVLFSLLSFHFIFIFYSPTSFTFTLPILFDLYYICCFISCLFYCIYYHFISLFIPHNPLSQKCRVKTNRFIHFSSRHIWKQVLLFLFLFWLLLFKETCFKFYLIAVLICYLHFIIHCRAHMPLEHWSRSFLAKLLAGCLELGKKWGLGYYRNIMLSAMVCWCVFNFQRVLYY